MSKKKIIAILLFIFISLFMFAFADTGKDKEDNSKSNIDNNEKVEEVSKEETDTDSEDNNIVDNNTAVDKEENPTLVLDLNGDEDKDGYTNGEEKEYGSDPLDPNSKPFDNIAPIITIKGQASLVIFVGDKYEDEGATAKDNLDGDITDQIVTSNSVNPLVAGNYEVTYTVKDRAGNSTTETRKVKVASLEDDEDKDGYTNGEEIDNNSDPLDPESKPEDKEIPIITLNGETPVVLLEGEEYEDEGATAKDNLDGDITEKIVTDNQVDTTVEGDYEVTYTVEDRAGNKATEKREVIVLSKDGDRDQDGYTNEEEIENNSDPLDPESKPVDNAPEITVNPTEVKIVEGVSYDVMTGVDVDDDFDTLTATANITETNTLSVGEHTVTYTVEDRAGNIATATRTLIVLSRRGDEDGDGYTNGEEIDNNSNPLDPESKPVDNTPIITVNPTEVKIVEGVSYDVMTGVDVDDDFDTLTATANITETDTLSVGEHTVTYTVQDRAGNTDTKTRTLIVLSRRGDEDQDGYTNEEELENNSDPLNPESKPVDNTPVITVNPIEVKIVEGVSYDVMTGVDVDDDFDILTATANITETNTLSVGEHTVTYTVQDRAGNTDTKTRTLIVLSRRGDEDQDGYTNGEEIDNNSDPLDPESKPVDKEVPVITLNGETPVVLLEGEEYEDAGATAKDNLDGDITEKIVTNNQVDTTVEGDYEVTYTVTDRAENTTTEKREVTVLSKDGDRDQDGYTNEEELENNSDPLDPESKPVDKEAPVITLNGENPVILLEGSEYKEAGAEATDNLDGDITNKIVIANGVNTEVAGNYEVTYTVEDRAGNKATEKREVIVLSKDEDEDGDGYTNEEELENNSDPLNPNSKPEDNAPIITINPNYVEINEDENYDVMTGVSATDDFDTITVSADITDTTVLNPGTYTITYTTTTDRIGQTGTATRTIVVKAIDKEPPVITANNVNANGQPEAIINVNVVDIGSGIKEVHYLPKEYKSVEDYMEAVNSPTQPVDPIQLTLDENGDAIITSYFDTTYTIYAVDNKGNATIKNVSTTGIKQGEDDVVSDDAATIDSIKGVTITVGKNTTQGYIWILDYFLKLNPKRSIKVSANEGYEVQSVKWQSGRQTLKYFQDGNGNEQTLEFTLGNSRYTNVYTLYVKTKNTTTNEIYEGVVYIYNSAYWLWGIARI